MSKARLIEAAKIAEGGDLKRKFRLGCVAKRRDGAIVSSTNSALQVPHHEFHAEARVLKKAGHGATLWVARIRRSNGEWTMAKPCSSCQNLIRSMKVKKVYYTISSNEFGTWYP